MHDTVVDLKENWRAGAASALQIRRWESKCRKLALDVECSPPKTSFSDQLTNLLSQETLISCDVRQASELSSKIDGLINSETYYYFQELCSQNIRSWQTFFDRHEYEYAEVKNELKKRCSALRTRAATHADTRASADYLIPLLTYSKRSYLSHQAESPAAAPVAAQLMELTAVESVPGYCFVEAERRFLKEERELRVRAHEDWAQTQKFDIDCAFGIQLARVDAEWAEYGSHLRRQHGETPKEPTHSHHNRWQNKEKQGLLANTAPVFEPNAQDSNVMPQIATPNEPCASAEQSKLSFAEDQLGQQGKMNLDLQRALDRVEFQKSNAKKWIRRQALRMLAQLHACRSLHQCMAQGLSSYYVKNRILAAAARKHDHCSLQHLGAMASRPVSIQYPHVNVYTASSENRNSSPTARLHLQSPSQFRQLRAESAMEKQLAAIRRTRGKGKQQKGDFGCAVLDRSIESSECQETGRPRSQRRPKTTALASRPFALTKPRDPRTSRQKGPSYAVNATFHGQQSACSELWKAIR